MIVVADTSPLCYLILIQEINLLPQLFDKIYIPQAVAEELGHKDSPTQVKNWLKHSPSWLIIEPNLSVNDDSLNHLHWGEKQAILLAEQTQADLLILDEKLARKTAKERGLKITGLLGILQKAHSQQLIDLHFVIQKLQTTNFRITPALLRSLLG
jgi:predicted nucleic acid-binding protein